MSIEELKKEIVGALARAYCAPENKKKVTDIDLIHAMEEQIIPLIDTAVSIADLQSSQKIAELERLHEAEIKEAVEREQNRIIGVIDAEIRYYYDKSERFGVKYRLISNALESIKKSILSTPQQEEV